MEGNADPDGERGLEDASTAEGDGDRGRYSMLARCASQSSLDESSQRRAGGDAGEAGEGAVGAQHATALLDALARLRCDATLCDVRLQAQAEGATEPAEGVWAHRAVLAACSPYFRAMFTQFDERTQDAVTIQNVEPHALEAIIEYVYNPNSLVITEDNVQSLLSASSLLQVSGVRAACCNFLAAALAPDNALGIRAFAELHACRDLKDCAARYVHRHFVEVLETEEFLSLTAETLAQLLDSDRIMVPNEEVVLDAVIRWMQHNPGERQQHLGTLLEHVRLPLLGRDVLVARAAAEPLAGAGLRVKDLVIEALSFHLLRPERRAAAAAACARARPRQPPRAPKMLLVVGGQAPKAIRSVEALQLEAGRWRRAADLPTRRCRAGLAVVAGKLYAVGGFNGNGESAAGPSGSVGGSGAAGGAGGTMPRARRIVRGVCGVRVALSASTSALPPPEAPAVLLLQRWRPPHHAHTHYHGLRAPVPPAAIPRPSCSYHLLPESQRAQGSNQGGERSCCEADTQPSDSSSESEGEAGACAPDPPTLRRCLAKRTPCRGSATAAGRAASQSTQTWSTASTSLSCATTATTPTWQTSAVAVAGDS
ncbi:Ring canal kelch-like [Papilio machaon]|uniref:Ring canal kelch-like n=1 Tax=Papilio machaon TaxID=76193 RepID=A0A194R5M4_PAPMA|nr:Ring canal kelch-like [Papilio machaon]